MAGIVTYSKDNKAYPITELPLREIYTSDVRFPLKLDEETVV